ncbi:MAG: PEP-CTERM sorting domain-containing protein [Pirellulales bacterium]|nr:PEP-CTERM sorting domain-containing protein [Pirellulales bacterium]
MLVLPLLGAGVAQAASVSYNNTYGPSSVGGPTLNVPLPKFDPALGTLTKVTLTLDANTNAGSMDFDNEAAGSTSVTLKVGASVVATGPGTLAVTAVPLQSNAGVVSGDTDGAPDFVGTDAISVTGGSGFDSDSDMSTAPAVLALFIASFLGETFNTSVDPDIATSLSTSGGFGPINPVPGLTDGLLTVTYEYNAVPEPSTIVLAGMGILGLIVARIRRK